MTATSLHSSLKKRILLALLILVAFTGAIPAKAQSADLSVTVFSSPLGNTATAGGDLTWLTTVENAGPDNAQNVLLFETIADGTFVSLSAAPGWTCTPPTVGSGPGAYAPCSIASLPVGQSSFRLTVHIPADATPGYFLTATSIVTATTEDPLARNNEFTAVLGVVAPPIPALQPQALLTLMVLLAAIGFLAIRRQWLN